MKQKTIIFFNLDGVDTCVVAFCKYQPAAGEILDVRLERGDIVRLTFDQLHRFVSFPQLHEATGVITYTTRAHKAVTIDEDAPEISADQLFTETR